MCVWDCTALGAAVGGGSEVIAARGALVGGQALAEAEAAAGGRGDGDGEEGGDGPGGDDELVVGFASGLGGFVEREAKFSAVVVDGSACGSGGDGG